jgi:pentatricopeptide repeat protein
VYGCVVEAAAVAGKPSVAAEVVRRMAAEGHPPNVVSYTSLLSSYGATGDIQGAEAVFADMAAAGCKPNAKTYTELMSQLAAKGE